MNFWQRSKIRSKTADREAIIVIPGDFSSFFYDRDHHIFKGIPHFWMADHKVNDRRFVFGYDDLVSFMDINLYILKCGRGIFLYDIVCILVLIIFHLV